MYLSFIRPLLEYGDVIWNISTQYLVDKVENVQIEAMRIVTGGTKLTSIQKLYTETGWEKLSDRREKHRLMVLYKIINQQTPEYLRNLVPNSVASVHGHFTRQSNNISEIRTRSNLYSDYFLPSTIKLWNKLPPDIRNSTSIHIFKNNLKNQSNKLPPKYYYAGSRQGQIFHSR